MNSPVRLSFRKRANSSATPSNQLLDPSLLETAVNKAETLKEASYAKADWTSLQEELSEAKEILRTSVSQAQVNETAMELNQTLLALRRLSGSGSSGRNPGLNFAALSLGISSFQTIDTGWICDFVDFACTAEKSGSQFPEILFQEKKGRRTEATKSRRSLREVCNGGLPEAALIPHAKKQRFLPSLYQGGWNLCFFIWTNNLREGCGRSEAAQKLDWTGNKMGNTEDGRVFP